MDGCIDIKAGVVVGRHAQFVRKFDGEGAHLFFGVLHCDLKQAMVSGGCGSAESDRATGLNLQV